jgi:hypothetical protein
MRHLCRRLADHGFCKSVCFFDLNGHRMEMTARTEKAGDREWFAAAAPAVLWIWKDRRRSGTPAST